jgi:hypothetical protein
VVVVSATVSTQDKRMPHTMEVVVRELLLDTAHGKLITKLLLVLAGKTLLLMAKLYVQNAISSLKLMVLAKFLIAFTMPSTSFGLTMIYP